MISERGKDLRRGKKTIVDYLSRTVFQLMSTAVAPMDQRLTSAKNQGKEASFPYSKPNVYPPSSMTRSPEEIVGRELFSEKSR
jgi:hypothetical protein